MKTSTVIPLKIVPNIIPLTDGCVRTFKSLIVFPIQRIVSGSSGVSGVVGKFGLIIIERGTYPYPLSFLTFNHSPSSSITYTTESFANEFKIVLLVLAFEYIFVS